VKQTGNSDDIRTIVLCMVYRLCLIFLFTAPIAYSQNAPLTLVQVQSLIRAHAPESVIQQQIQQRGLGFPVTPNVLEEIQKMGASENLVAQLHAELQAGNIEVHTLPQSVILIDNKKAGITNSNGVFLAEELSTGNHSVTAARTNFKDGVATVTVGNHETQKVDVSLIWLGGYLTIITYPEDASVDVQGPQGFTGHINDVPCPAGEYTIHVSRDGMKPETRTIDVISEIHHTEKIRLTPTPAYLAQLVYSAQDKLSHNDPVGAFRIASTVRGMDPKNINALDILTSSTFELGDEKAFLIFARSELHRGGTVTLPLLHIHSSPTLQLHDVEMKISSAGVVLHQQPTQSYCALDDSLIPASAINSIKITQDSRRYEYLHFSYSVVDSSDATKAQNLSTDFVLNGTIVQPGHVHELLDGIVNLLNDIHAQ